MKKGNIITDNKAYGCPDVPGDDQKDVLGQKRGEENNELIQMAAEQFANLFFEYCQFERTKYYRRSKKKSLCP